MSGLHFPMYTVESGAPHVMRLRSGFAATMVFAIGPRILPHFAGIQSIFSKRLMLLSLLCLQTGCLLRVTSEPLAYEGIVSFAWKVLPVSGMLELSGVLIFAANLGGHVCFSVAQHSR